MAQTVFQVSGLWDDSEYADLQGLQQTAVLRSPHTQSKSDDDGGNSRAKAHCGKHKDPE